MPSASFQFINVYYRIIISARADGNIACLQKQIIKVIRCQRHRMFVETNH